MIDEKNGKRRVLHVHQTIRGQHHLLDRNHRVTILRPRLLGNLLLGQAGVKL